ncbi:MAG: hypothetical protein E6K98_04380, partial [Thaumarchaeota archaeon]
MKLGFLLIVLIILPIIIQTSFASNSNMMMGKYTLNCDHKYYDISYQISNATLIGVPSYISDKIMLSMLIQNSTNGIITISFARQFMDMKSGNQDDEFIVVANNREISSHVIDKSNSTHRILTINLPSGNSDLGIVGTGIPENPSVLHGNCVVVPEFGSLALMIVSVGIFGVI